MPERTDTAAPPEYKLYRARPRLLQRGRDGSSMLDELRGTPPGAPPKRRRRITVGRVVKWLALAVVGWLVLSLVLFLVSATLQQDAVPSSAQAQLDRGGVGLTSPQTTLVLGSDRRTPGTKEPGASVHVVLDNYGTHKTPAVKRWFLRHPEYHLHFIPTSSSWLDLHANVTRNHKHADIAPLMAEVTGYLSARNAKTRAELPKAA